MSERSAILREILLAAPPGQFDTVLSDLRVISEAAGDPLTDEWTEQVRSEHQEATTSVQEADTLTGDPLLSSALKKRLESYKNKYYSSKGVVAVVSVSEGTVVRSYAERLDLGNCHAGSWTATWNIQERRIRGEILLKVICHEEGSTQLQSSRAFGPVTVEESSNDETLLAEAFVLQMSQWEQNMLDSMGCMYDAMGDNLKALRRVLPITRKRLDWNAQAHRMAKTLGDSSAK